MTHTKVKCPICSKELTSKWLKEHMIETHGEKGRYQCQMCEKSFHRSTQFQKHTNKHNGIRNDVVICNYCEKPFTVGRLKNHMIGNHGEKGRYQCKMCEKSFHNMGEFKKHTLTHTSEKPFKCSKCELSFASKSNRGIQLPMIA